jgi:hypothetical protein
VPDAAEQPANGQDYPLEDHYPEEREAEDAEDDKERGADDY